MADATKTEPPKTDSKAKAPVQKLTPTQARAARRARRQSRKALRRYAIFAGVGLVAAVLLVSLFLPSLPFGRGGGNIPENAPGQRYDDQGTTHIQLGESHAPYNSIPATSGWHYSQPNAPVAWGVYNDPIPDEVLIHNLEHGGVGVHYNCPDGCPDDVAKLVNFYQGRKVVVSPYPNMPTKFALTAWNYLDAFDVYDEARIAAFLDAHISSGNAPEWNVP